jgi:signal-transduction protein with cAMP-binding, CBS, and nucleotidyltransferase domain
LFVRKDLIDKHDSSLLMMYSVSDEYLMTSETPSNEPLRALLTAKNRLEYLTPNDWALLAYKSEVVSFSNEEAVIQAGVRPRHLFFILNGTAAVESARGVRVADISEGEVCGEMSFLEDSIASARVVAVGDVKALSIEWTALHHLFELYPHLGSRFYHSLALNLSRRLRKQLSRSGVQQRTEYRG